MLPLASPPHPSPVRLLLLSYANIIQPFRPPSTFQQIADALNGDPEKAPGCDIDAELRRQSLSLGTPGASQFIQRAVLPSTNTFYADPVTGNDANNGSLAFPFKTIGAALAASRAAPGNDTILLRAGTFYQASTIVLGTADSGLTIQSYPGEEAWVSGATPLGNLSWTPFNVNASSWALYPSTNALNPGCGCRGAGGWGGRREVCVCGGGERERGSQ